MYKLIRTDTADSGLRKIILYLSENFGNDVALEKLDEIEKQIMLLKEAPYIGRVPSNKLLCRRGYRVFVVGKNLIFYKNNDMKKEVTIFAIVDQHQDYMSIIDGQ